MTLHGITLTIAKIREDRWIPIRRSHGCKRFQAKAFANPPPGNLPRDRTERTTPFEDVGGQSKEKKAYILLYACSLTRGLYLQLTSTMETEEFSLRSLKRLIARRGRPKKIY